MKQEPQIQVGQIIILGESNSTGISFHRDTLTEQKVRDSVVKRKLAQKPLFARLFLRVGQKRRGWSKRWED